MRTAKRQTMTGLRTRCQTNTMPQTKRRNNWLPNLRSLKPKTTASSGCPRRKPGLTDLMKGAKWSHPLHTRYPAVPRQAYTFQQAQLPCSAFPYFDSSIICQDTVRTSLPSQGKSYHDIHDFLKSVTEFNAFIQGESDKPPDVRRRPPTPEDSGHKRPAGHGGSGDERHSPAAA